MHPRGTQPLCAIPYKLKRLSLFEERGLSNLHLTLDAVFKLNFHTLTRHRVCFIRDVLDAQCHLKIFPEPHEEAFNKWK